MGNQINEFQTEALSPINKTETTQYLLKSISKRLAGREDCKSLEYIVRVSYKGVEMNPLILVYPNRHRKSDSDKIDIISYVHRYRLQDITLDQLEFGTYKYELNHGRRRWIRI